MTFTCYEPRGMASVMGIDLADRSGHQLFEGAGHVQRGRRNLSGRAVHAAWRRTGRCEQLGGQRGSGNIDIWKLQARWHGKGFHATDALQRLRGRQSIEPGGLDRRPVHGVSDCARPRIPRAWGTGSCCTGSKNRLPFAPNHTDDIGPPTQRPHVGYNLPCGRSFTSSAACRFLLSPRCGSLHLVSHLETP